MRINSSCFVQSACTAATDSVARTTSVARSHVAYCPGAAPRVLRADQRAVHAAPQHEVPAGPVPQSAEQHGYHYVAVACETATAIPAQRDIEIVAQEARQRDVPAAPEIDDRYRFVG